MAAIAQPVQFEPLPVLVKRVLEEEKGITDATSARRTVDSFFPSEHFWLSTTLTEVPLDTKLNLYRSVAAEDHPEKIRCLAHINDNLGLSDSFYWPYSRHVESYFATKFRTDVRERRIEGVPAETVLNRFVKNDPRLPKNTKIEVIRFLAIGYAEYNNFKIRIHFYRDSAENYLYGKQTDDNVYINTYPLSNPNNSLRVGCISHHEIKHVAHLADSYRCWSNGERALKREEPAYEAVLKQLFGNRPLITASHEDFAVVRVFAANQAGYIPYRNKVGFEAYWHQPMEISSRYEAELAEDLLPQTLTELSRARKYFVQPDLQVAARTAQTQPRALYGRVASAKPFSR